PKNAATSRTSWTKSALFPVVRTTRWQSGHQSSPSACPSGDVSQSLRPAFQYEVTRLRISGGRLGARIVPTIVEKSLSSKKIANAPDWAVLAAPDGRMV